jgi:FixJ family two-component response regulator
MNDPEALVFIVDDDTSTREALKLLLHSVRLRVQDFPSADAFLAADRPDVPSCVILDVRMPGASGLDLQQQLLGAGIHIPLIFLTGHADVRISVRAMKAGAAEFLTKPASDQELIDAVHQAIAASRQARARSAELGELRRRFELLTSRERQVLGLVVDGRLNKQIAGELGLSLVTVKLHRGHLMQKMQAGSVAELVKIAQRLNGASK